MLWAGGRRLPSLLLRQTSSFFDCLDVLASQLGSAGASSLGELRRSLEVTRCTAPPADVKHAQLAARLCDRRFAIAGLGQEAQCSSVVSRLSVRLPGPLARRKAIPFARFLKVLGTFQTRGGSIGRFPCQHALIEQPEASSLAPIKLPEITGFPVKLGGESRALPHSVTEHKLLGQ